MCAQTLRSYFENETQQKLALHRIVSKGWLDAAGNMELYEASWRAFDPSLSEDEGFRYFEKIYSELRGPHWQVFCSRNGDSGSWSSQQIFETIRSQFADFSWRRPVNLLTLDGNGELQRIRSGLVAMQNIKPNKGYPVMAVSKFLHFYNPALFPIYDTAVIWIKVFETFKQDFRAFCEDVNIDYESAVKDGTEAFLLYYMQWAHSLLSVAHNRFMPVFVDWLTSQSGTVNSRHFDVTSLYATAFEFTVIGAVPE